MSVTLISSDALKMMKAKERMDLKKCFSCKNIKNSEAAKVKFYLIERTNKILYRVTSIIVTRKGLLYVYESKDKKRKKRGIIMMERTLHWVINFLRNRLKWISANSCSTYRYIGKYTLRLYLTYQVNTLQFLTKHNFQTYD